MQSRSSVEWGKVGVFVGLVLLGPWLLAAPFHLGLVEHEGVSALLLAVVCMWVPLVVTVLMLATLDRGPRAAARVGLGIPGGRWLRWLGVMALAILIPSLAGIASPFVAAWLGWTTLDLTTYSGFRAMLEQQLAGQSLDEALGGLSVGVVVWLIPVSFAIGGIVNVLLGAMGEELGWRGWLQDKLMPLGAWPAMALVGVVWGIWHAPLILLGHNYPDTPILGIFLFIPFCVLWGVLHGVTRIWTGSVWPAALMHGTLNATPGFFVVLLDASITEIDPIWVTLVGVSGWILPAVAVAGLAVWNLLDRDLLVPVRPKTPEDAPTS